MIACKRNATRQSVLTARRMARKIVKGLTCLGLQPGMMPDIQFLEKPHRYVAIDDAGVPAFEIRTPKAHALHLANALGTVTALRRVRSQDPNRRIHAQVLEVLNVLGNPAEARKTRKMEELQWMKDRAAQVEKEMYGDTAEEATDDGTEETDQTTDQKTEPESGEGLREAASGAMCEDDDSLQQGNEVDDANAS